MHFRADVRGIVTDDSEERDHDSGRSGGTGSAASGRATDASQSGSGAARGASSPDSGNDGSVNSDDGSRAETSKQQVRPRLYSEGDWGREVRPSTSRPDRLDETRDWARIIHSASFRRLQGKTQVFPVYESDFFRNRLTHSLEVAQIAEGIAQKLNYDRRDFELRDGNKINERLCMVAGLIHDLGHPPFGHNGERALDDCMRSYGGFEGNAQTIRIIAHLEKKCTLDDEGAAEGTQDDPERRAGLALTYRSILSALKYDELIPNVRGETDELIKGYYHTEERIIQRAKASVDPDWSHRDEFKTIECSIMDVADDIAYSTYDLEDILKAGFLTPASILSTNLDVFERVAKKANKTLKKKFKKEIDGSGALDVFVGLFEGLMTGVDKTKDMDLYTFGRMYTISRNISEVGNDRTRFSTTLVADALRGILFEYDAEAPWLSKVGLNYEALKQVEVLKHFTYESTIYSARVKTGEYRGYDVVKNIFDALAKAKGLVLMPDDVRDQYRRHEDNATARMRAISDFIAGMTDRYALEFHARMYSDHPQSIFKTV